MNIEIYVPYEINILNNRSRRNIIVLLLLQNNPEIPMYSFIYKMHINITLP